MQIARRARHPVVAALGAGVLALALGGCARELPTTSPEEAFGKLLDACDSGDAARLFDALDTRTQWAVETVHDAQRTMRGLVVDTYPPAERDAALSRLPAACAEDLDRPRRYFRALPGSAGVLAEVKRRIYLGTGQPVGSVRKKEGIAEVWREGGSVFHFARDDKGRWGWMEQRDVWEHARERALHELEVVQQNAALYRRRRGEATPADLGSHGAPATPATPARQGTP